MKYRFECRIRERGQNLAKLPLWEQSRVHTFRTVQEGTEEEATCKAKKALEKWCPAAEYKHLEMTITLCGNGGGR